MANHPAGSPPPPPAAIAEQPSPTSSNQCPRRRLRARRGSEPQLAAAQRRHEARAPGGHLPCSPNDDGRPRHGRPRQQVQPQRPGPAQAKLRRPPARTAPPPRPRPCSAGARCQTGMPSERDRRRQRARRASTEKRRPSRNRPAPAHRRPTRRWCGPARWPASDPTRRLGERRVAAQLDAQISRPSRARRLAPTTRGRVGPPPRLASTPDDTSRAMATLRSTARGRLATDAAGGAMRHDRRLRRQAQADAQELDGAQRQHGLQARTPRRPPALAAGPTRSAPSCRDPDVGAVPVGDHRRPGAAGDLLPHHLVDGQVDRRSTPAIDRRTPARAARPRSGRPAGRRASAASSAIAHGDRAAGASGKRARRAQLVRRARKTQGAQGGAPAASRMYRAFGQGGVRATGEVAQIRGRGGARLRRRRRPSAALRSDGRPPRAPAARAGTTAGSWRTNRRRRGNRGAPRTRSGPSRTRAGRRPGTGGARPGRPPRRAAGHRPGAPRRPATRRRRSPGARIRPASPPGRRPPAPRDSWRAPRRPANRARPTRHRAWPRRGGCAAARRARPRAAPARGPAAPRTAPARRAAAASPAARPLTATATARASALSRPRSTPLALARSRWPVTRRTGSASPGPVIDTDPSCMVTLSACARRSQPAAKRVPVTWMRYPPARICQCVCARWMTETSTVPSSTATVAPSLSSASTCAAARGGSVTAEPSEKLSASGLVPGATMAAPTRPSAVSPATANDSGCGRSQTKAASAAQAPGAGQGPGPRRHPARLARLDLRQPRLDLRHQVAALGVARRRPAPPRA